MLQKDASIVIKYKYVRAKESGKGTFYVTTYRLVFEDHKKGILLQVYPSQNELIKALRETINREQARHHYNLSQVLLAVSVIYNELLILLTFNICQQYPKIMEALKDSNNSSA